MSSISQYLLLVLFVAVIQLSFATTPDTDPYPKNIIRAHTFPILNAPDMLSAQQDPDPENPPVRSSAAKLARKLLNIMPPPLWSSSIGDPDIHMYEKRPNILPPKIIFPLPIVPPITALSVMSEPTSKEMPAKYDAVMMHMPGDGFMPEPQPEPFMLRLEGEFDILKIARSAAGFVGADLNALVDEARNLAIDRITNAKLSGRNLEDWPMEPWSKAEMRGFRVKMADFENAAKIVQPSLRREGFASIPNVTWSDIGGMSVIRKVFERYLIQRIKHPEYYKESGINLESGFLLFGPPGCGKTLIAKVVAKEAGATFIHIKGPELLDKYVGESELKVREIFTNARTNTPCIIFFDEIDTITTSRRDLGNEGGSRVIESILTQLLIELDGAGNRDGVYVIGATNRVEVMDPAVLRKGRLGKRLYVPLPGADERAAIMKAHAKGKLFDADVNLDALACADRCNNLSGADIASLMNEAAMFALEERLDLADEAPLEHKCVIKASHLEQAISQISPSLSHEEREYYETLAKKYQVL